MRRNLYIAAFVAVLLIACIGGFVGGRVLLSRLQGDFSPPGTPPLRPSWSPHAGRPPDGAARSRQCPRPPATEAPPRDFHRPGRARACHRPARGARPPSRPGPPASICPRPSSLADRNAVPSMVRRLPRPDRTPIPAYPFVARSRRPLYQRRLPRHLHARRRDRSRRQPAAWHPPDPRGRIRQRVYRVTKPGPGDTGRYDFPMGGPGRQVLSVRRRRIRTAPQPACRDPARLGAPGRQELPVGRLAAENNGAVAMLLTTS